MSSDYEYELLSISATTEARAESEAKKAKAKPEKEEEEDEEGGLSKTTSTGRNGSSSSSSSSYAEYLNWNMIKTGDPYTEQKQKQKQQQKKKNIKNKKGGSSFLDLQSYVWALSQTHSRLRQRAGKTWPIEHELNMVRSRSGARLRKTLEWVDMVCLGVGGMVGAGVFVTAGVAARRLAGPSLVLSFLCAGFSALLSAFCYAEFSVQLPSAGGAFSYIRISLGEFAAYITGANLLLEYVISNAAVARTFTSYLATIFGYDGRIWLIKLPGFVEGSYYLLDFPAFGLVSMLTVCICLSTKRSSRLNILMTLLHVALIFFIMAAGFWNGKARNLTHPGNPSHNAGFFPFGMGGVLEGAAVVYFSFIGYDSVSTMAEEVKNPSRNMPIGIAGSVVLVTVLYCAMAMALTLVLPYDEIDVDAPFAKAFRSVVGWTCVSNIVGIGACLGILTSLLVAMLGQARYLCVIARARLVPAWLAKVNTATGTPVRSSVFLGALTSTLALVVDSAILVDLVSIGTLFVFYMVANALIFRRHVVPGVTNPWPTSLFLIATTLLSVGFIAILRSVESSASHYHYHHRWVSVLGLGACGAGIIVATMIFWACVPTVKPPAIVAGSGPGGDPLWRAPCMPWLAVFSIFVNVVLAGSLNRQAFSRFGMWTLIALLFYVGYGIHAAHDAEEEEEEEEEEENEEKEEEEEVKIIAMADNLLLEEECTLLDVPFPLSHVEMKVDPCIFVY